MADEHRYSDDGNYDERTDREREEAEEEKDTADEYYKESEDDE